MVCISQGRLPYGFRVRKAPGLFAAAKIDYRPVPAIPEINRMKNQMTSAETGHIERNYIGFKL